MKKSLIALAALTAFATVAQAQSSVTVSGRVDMGYSDKELDVKATTNSNTSTNTIVANTLATSFIALSGSEDLGGGLKANFRVETGFTGAAATTLGDRAAWLELNGGFGSLRAGLQNTDHRDTWTSFSQAGAINPVGDLNSSTAEDAGGTSGHTAFKTAIKYSTPTVNGFSASASIAKATVDTTGVKSGSDGQSFGAKYATGKFRAAVATSKTTSNTAAVAAVAAKDATYYTSSGVVTTTSGSNTLLTAAVTAVSAAAAYDTDEKINSAAAEYDFGVAKVSAIYMKKTQQATNSSVKALDRDSMTYGISAPVGKAVLFAQYGTGENVTSGTTTADLKAYQVGARYFLSKRTLGYIATGNVKHEVSATNKNDYSETVVGLLHTF
jgi:predicted porin